MYIDGVKEIDAAIEAQNHYREEFDRMMDDEYNDGVFPPKKPTVKLSELQKQFPTAYDYIVARNWKESKHLKKSFLGNQAMIRIENGEPHDAVIKEMQSEWNNYCNEHMWD